MSAKLKEALAPLAVRMRQRESLVQPVSQVLIELPRNAQSFARARSSVLTWMNARAGRRLPQSAWDGRSFELNEIGSQRAEAVAIDNPNYWAARLDDADKNVALRTWTTEIGLAETPDGNVMFGCRLTASSRDGDLPAERSIPGFVAGILRESGATLDGRVISERPWLIEDRAGVAQLAGVLTRKSRRVDVIALSLPEGSNDFSQTSCCANELARRLAGAAHVVVLTSDASFFLSDLFGKEFSAYRGAVRTYHAGFDPEKDGPYAHPLTMAARIANWSGGRKAFESNMIDRALARSVQSADAESAMPSFLSVKRTAADAKIAEVKTASIRHDDQSDKLLIGMLEEEVATARKAVDDERELGAGLLAAAEKERDEANDELLRLRDVERQLRARLRSVSARGQSASPETTPIPETLDDFEQWCAEHLAGSVEIHPRCYNAIKKSNYGDTSLIYRTLLMLRDQYVPMRREGGKVLKQAFEEQCKALGLAEEPTCDQSRAGEQRSEYFIKHRGTNRFLGRHLKRGNSMDTRYCFRAYFHWDDEDAQVIVGWLPTHLVNRST